MSSETIKVNVPVTIPVSKLGTVPTILFINITHSNPEPIIWVCQDAEQQAAVAKQLQAESHIRVLAVSNSVVVLYSDVKNNPPINAERS